MLKISDLSENCYKSELELFSLPPTQVAVESGMWDTIQPISGYEKNPSVEFKIPGDSLHYLDLSQTELYVRVKISNITPDTTSEFMVAKKVNGFPVNNFLHSLFQDVTVRFNSTIVEQSQSMYPYRAYLEDLLNYDGESKNTFLQRQCFFKDVQGQFENFRTDDRELSVVFPEKQYAAEGAFMYSNTATEPNQKLKERTFTVNKGSKTQNDGAIQRRAFLRDSQLMKGKFHLDTFNMNRYLLNNVDVNISMKKSNKAFCILQDSDEDLFNIEFVSMYLKVRRIVVAPSIMFNHAMALEKTNAKYPIKKVLVKPIALEYNSNFQILTNVHSGIMPNRILLAFTSTNAQNGQYKLNPFNFKHFNMQSLSIKVASQNVPYSSPLEFRPSENYDIIEAYNSLFSGIREAPNDITYQDYKNGYFIFAFDLTPDLCSSEHYNILKDGNMEIALKFNNTSTNGAITMITYLEFDNVLEITKSRNILCNYQ